jgi:hypothetical protein
MKDVTTNYGFFGLYNCNSGEIRRLNFINNHIGNSNQGGAFYTQILDGKTVLFEDCNFTGCGVQNPPTTAAGGAINAYTSSAAHTGILKLIRCKFSSCTALEG